MRLEAGKDKLNGTLSLARGQYTHRVAITNNRILKVDENTVMFLHKDYADESRKKPVTLSGVEFLRRFCMHILPLRFVKKIRRYGVYSSQQKGQLQKLKGAKKALQIKLPKYSSSLHHHLTSSPDFLPYFH